MICLQADKPLQRHNIIGLINQAETRYCMELFSIFKSKQWTQLNVNIEKLGDNQELSKKSLPLRL